MAKDRNSSRCCRSTSRGAVSLKNKPGKFSSQGYNADGIVKPDIAACGVLAWVASPSGSYYQGYGTSYATPIAAGGVACLLQAYPELNPQQIRDLIKATALTLNLQTLYVDMVWLSLT